MGFAVPPQFAYHTTKILFGENWRTRLPTIIGLCYNGHSRNGLLGEQPFFVNKSWRLPRRLPVETSNMVTMVGRGKKSICHLRETTT